MTTEKRNKLFRLTRKLIALSRRPATPENADRFFRHYLRAERISRGISPFKTLGGGGENNGQPRGSAVAAQFNFVPSKTRDRHTNK